MNGKDIFRGLQYIGDDLIENAETGQFPAQNQESGKTRRPIRRPLLIAALIALLLLLVGPPLEEKYGWKKMAWFMAVTALVTGLVQFIFFPHTALLGASGVVFMMIVLSSFTESRAGGIPVTLILVVIFYLGGEIVDGLKGADSVSQLTHVVGGVLGMIFGFLYRGKRHR